MASSLLGLGDTDSLLTCSICLEDMVGRQPRSLSCLHSYCHECLEDLLKYSKNGNLSCPTCKRETKITRKGLETLPVDFRVQQFADELKSRTTSLICDVCNINKVSSKCHHVDCGLRLCLQCTDRHNRQLLFKDHHIVVMDNDEAFLCEKHSREVRYLCNYCLTGACAKCVLDDDHSTHEAELVCLDEGLDAHKEKVRKLCEQYQQALEPKVTFWEMSKNRLGSLQEMDGRIANRASEITSNVIQETEQMREHLKKNYIECTQSVVDTFNMLEIAQNGLSWSLHMVNSDAKIFLKNLNPMIEYMKNTIECIKSYVPVEFQPLPSLKMSSGNVSVATLLNIDDQENETEPNSETSELCKSRVSLILHVHQIEGIELVSPREISVMDDHCVLVADMGLTFAFVLGEKCDVTQRFRPSEAMFEAGLVSVSNAYGSSMPFFFTHSNINAIFEKTSTSLLILKHPLPPGIQNVSSIAVDENRFAILACRHRLILYDLETMEYIVVAQNFMNASRVKIVKYKKEKMYLVCDTAAGVIYIYTYESVVGGGIRKDGRIKLTLPDSRTKLLYQSSINEGKDYVLPYEGVTDATFNSAGNLLVADIIRKSVREVKVTGEVLGVVISPEDTLASPCSIAYSNGKLWVTECDPFLHSSSIKLFRLNEA